MMADPRYKNGIHKSCERKVPIKIDRPQDHGWTFSHVSPSTGYDIFIHSGAPDTEIRAGTRAEDYDWIVCQAGYAYGINGSLADLTADLVDIPFDGRPMEPPGPAEVDDYGLEAVA